MAQLASDDFNRANGGLGANWTTVGGSQTAPAINSNGVVPGGVSVNDSSAFYNGVTWPNDQYSQVQGITAASGSIGQFAMIRGTSAACTYYRAGVSDSAYGGSCAWKVQKAVTGTFTTISSGTTSISANDTLYLEAQGTSLKFKVNSTSISTPTDSAIASGSAGLALYVDSGSVTDSKLDNWAAGDFSASDTIFAQAVF